MSHRLLALLALVVAFFGLSAQARAGEIAVLDFDGYRVTYNDASLVSQGLRDAFLEEGSWFPLTAFEITDKLATGHEDGVNEARGLIAEARQALDAGSYSRAKTRLDQARQLHEAAGSPIARRPEMADIHYFLALSELGLGRSSMAAGHFKRALLLYPGYPEDRAPGLSASARSGFARAATAIDGDKKGGLSPEQADALCRQLGVGALVTGYLAADGTVFVRMFQGPRIVAEATRVAPEVPPFPGDPIYKGLVKELLTAAPAVAAPPPVAPVAPPDMFQELPPLDSPPDSTEPEFVELPDLDDPSDAEEQPVDDGSTQSQPADEAPVRRIAERDGLSWPWQEEGDVISGARGTPKAQDPITQQWWFWTATGAVAVGGVTTATVLLWPDGEPQTGDTVVSGDSSYTAALDYGGVED